MVQPRPYLKETPSQTAGPYVHIGCTPNFAEIRGVFAQDLGSGPLYSDGVRGERITIRGRVIDALVEIWQADADGLYPSPSETRGTADPSFRGWGRCPCDMTTGEFVFETIKPGRAPFRENDPRPMAPHVLFWIVARGINIGLLTRMYFSDEEAANAADPMLSRIEHQIRVPTLIGRREGDTVTFDIHLQGAQETIFFDM